MNASSDEWYRLVCNYVSQNYLDAVSVLTPPATAREFAMLESLWGVEIPEEFRSFYSFSNGFGVRIDDGDEVHWIFVPIEQLPQFTLFQRDFFFGTCPRIARSFFPFIGFTPDCHGYLHLPENELGQTLWYYEDAAHGHVKSYSPDHDWRYFLQEREGIKSFLDG